MVISVNKYLDLAQKAVGDNDANTRAKIKLLSSNLRLTCNSDGFDLKYNNMRIARRTRPIYNEMLDHSSGIRIKGFTYVYIFVVKNICFVYENDGIGSDLTYGNVRISDNKITGLIDRIKEMLDVSVDSKFLTDCKGVSYYLKGRTQLSNFAIIGVSNSSEDVVFYLSIRADNANYLGDTIDNRSFILRFEMESFGDKLLANVRVLDDGTFSMEVPQV